MIDLLHLRGDVVVEPLVNRWYAAPLLIAPATAAMLVENLHLPMLESFVVGPEVHRAAARNPALRGGPFIDFNGDVESVVGLIEEIKVRLAPQRRLAAAIRQLHALLKRESSGTSLAILYSSIPEELKGFVEIGYDLANHASMRLIEGLLYESCYYDEASQTLSISRAASDQRPYVGSTPRIGPTAGIEVAVPFRSEAIDMLASLRTSAAPRGEIDGLIEERLRVDPRSRDAFMGFFEPGVPASVPAAGQKPRELRVRYFGHATVLVETPGGASILTDPVVPNMVPGVPRYSFHDLPARIDYVLITHAHQDHLMFESLLQLRGRVANWVVPKNSGGALQDPSLKLMLKRLGFRNVIELDEMEQIEFTGGVITGLPFFGEHGDLHVRTKLAYHLRCAGTSFVFLADSNALDVRLYENIRGYIGDVDTLFIGMECEGAPVSWLYGPLFPTRLDRRMDDSRRLNGSDCARALGIVRCLNPRSVYVYAMGQEPWLSHVSGLAYSKESPPIVESNRFVQECRAAGIAAERLFGRKMLMREQVA